jgi:hypothetical protein
MNPFVAHFIGDFILQNEWMACNKKLRSLPCLVHVLVYIVPFPACYLQWWQIILIGVQHLAQDRTEFIFFWMRQWKRVHPDYSKELPLYVDQSFHLVWIEIAILLGKI